MGNTKNFFKRKNEWSEIKDSILGAYLRPYLAKIVRTRKAVRIADCFAGKGRFEDGNNGSPIIIKDAICKQLQYTPTASVKGIFIEKKYVANLRHNLPEDEHIHILEGDYEERMNHFITSYAARNRNLFLYVDPYGIKSLKMAHFKAIASMPFYTSEFLINFNAHGFLREGCRLLKRPILSGEPLQEDYEPDVNSTDNLDAIAGGKYWRSIVESYYRTHNLHAAEDALVAEYIEKFKRVFKYVIQFPVKIKLAHIAKYRMIYGTNHEDGLLLMAENMALRWKEFRDRVRPQGMLFEMDFPEHIVGMGTETIRTEILKHLKNKVSLKFLLVKLVQVFGVSFSLSHLKDVMKEMVKAKQVVVTRQPDKKQPSGKPITGWDHSGRNGYQVNLERNSQWQQNLL